MKFLDEAKIFIKAGNGGSGCASFRKEKFLELERIAGRKREKAEIFWGPRSLDIDFISWGELHINTETLILPHPRLSERNFVLIPLAEVLSKSQGKPKRINSQNIWPE